MVPWSIRRVTGLSPNAKLRERQQNTHGLVQLMRATTPNVPNRTPIPQLSKQMLNACPIPPMHIIVRLLPGRQSPILSSNEWHNDMNPAFISAAKAPSISKKSPWEQDGPNPFKTAADIPGAKGQIHIVHIQANPYPQLDRGWSISPAGKGLVHIPNRKGAMQKAWIRAPYQTWPKKMSGARPGAHPARRHSPYKRSPQRGHGSEFQLLPTADVEPPTDADP